MDLSLPFTRRYRVRFDEAGADGLVRVASLVRYLQDLAWQHSEAAGFDRAWYAERGMGWLVRGQELEPLGGAAYGDEVAVTTQVIGWRRMWARRRTEIVGPDGAPILRAHIDWVLLDTSSGRPVRIPAELEAFAPAAETFTPVRVDLPEPPATATSVPTAVRPSDADPMGHLNNAGYVDLVDDALVALSGRGIPHDRTLRLEYLLPARPGLDLASVLWETGTGWAYRLVDRTASVDLLRATLG